MVRWLWIWWMWKMLENIQIYILAIKYFIQGDEWKFAVEYATGLVKGWKK